MKGGGFFDTKIAENTYNETTLNMTSKLATVTTGVKRFFYSSPHGTVGLFATAKAGVATGDGSATAVFGGGGGIKVFLAGAANSGTVDIQQINGTGVSPTFGFSIGVDSGCRLHRERLPDAIAPAVVMDSVVGSRLLGTTDAQLQMAVEFAAQ